MDTRNEIKSYIVREGILAAPKGGSITISNTYGYIRVSTREQNEDRQVIALGEVGVSGKQIYMDK